MHTDKKKIIYVDMDFVLCDYASGFAEHQQRFPELRFPQSQPGLYLNLKPIQGAIDVYCWLTQQPELKMFILTSPSLKNPHSYSEKRLWVEHHLGFEAVNNLIITPNKGLNRGDYLIDDNATGKGQEQFEGQLLQFGTNEFPNWQSIRSYFEVKLKIWRNS